MQRVIIEAMRKRGIRATIARGGFLLPGMGFVSTSAAKELVGFDEGKACRHHGNGSSRRTDWPN